MRNYQLFDAVCISSNAATSVFSSNHGQHIVRNRTIRPGALPDSAFDSIGGVKVGTAARLFRIHYPDGKSATFISDPSLEHRRSAPAYHKKDKLGNRKKGSSSTFFKDLFTIIKKYLNF